ncbi:MAG: CinA family protein [Anaerolineae bacterium]|nr:CinA family protein [Anaerolineae bacterium]
MKYPESDRAARAGIESKNREWRLAVAGSYTGGLLAYRLTCVPDSSVYFLGGMIVYAE